MGKIPKIRPKVKTEILPKRYNQRRVNRLFAGGLIGWTLLASGVIVSNIVKNINVESQPKLVKQDASKEKVDYRLQNYMDGFVYYYFTFSDDEDQQKEQQQKLNAYYGGQNLLRGAGQYQYKNESALNSYKLLEVSDREVTYLVSYTVKKKVRNDDGQVEVQDEKVVTELTIPYGKKGSGYYVADLPYFTSVSSSQAQNEAELEFSGNVSEADKKSIDEFLELFFSNYVSSQENLDLLAKNVKVLPNTIFESLDWSVASRSKEDVVRVYAQVSFSVAGTVRSENFTFDLSEEEGSYKIKKMYHGLENK